VLEQWPVPDGGFDRFTTVSTWRAPFGPIEPYGLKHHQWRTFLHLPAETKLPFEVALDIDPADAADRNALDANGWHVVDPAVAAEPDGFGNYVRGSGAEFSVAQGIYVETKSGWFSDRSTRYLASADRCSCRTPASPGRCWWVKGWSRSEPRTRQPPARGRSWTTTTAMRWPHA
jgi:hypothetical protein